MRSKLWWTGISGHLQRISSTPYNPLFLLSISNISRIYSFYFFIFNIFFLPKLFIYLEDIKLYHTLVMPAHGKSCFTFFSTVWGFFFIINVTLTVVNRSVKGLGSSISYLFCSKPITKFTFSRSMHSKLTSVLYHQCGSAILMSSFCTSASL